MLPSSFNEVVWRGAPDNANKRSLGTEAWNAKRALKEHLKMSNVEDAAAAKPHDVGRCVAEVLASVPVDPKSGKRDVVKSSNASSAVRGLVRFYKGLGNDDMVSVIETVRDGGAVPPPPPSKEDVAHVLDQVTVGSETVCFRVLEVKRADLDGLPGRRELPKTEFETLIEPEEGSDNIMPVHTRARLEKTYADEGGIVYTVGVYDDPVQAAFARERCIDIEYMRSGRRNLYKRHYDFDDPVTTSTDDVESLPDRVDVRMWGGGSVDNVRNKDVDAFRAFMEEMLLSRLRAKGCTEDDRRCTVDCRHRISRGVELLCEFFETMTSHRHESENEHEATQAEKDVRLGAQALRDAFGEAVRLSREVKTAVRREEELLRDVESYRKGIADAVSILTRDQK